MTHPNYKLSMHVTLLNEETMEIETEFLDCVRVAAIARDFNHKHPLWEVAFKLLAKHLVNDCSSEMSSKITARTQSAQPVTN